MSARKLTRLYSSMVYWRDGLIRVTSCWHAEKAGGITYTEEERKKLHEASRLFRQAQELVNELYAARIGQAVASEIRAGTYRGAR